MKNSAPTLEPDKFYHVYNRANGSEKLFLTDDNYHFFLNRFRYYILPFADVFSYCLMPNHFHFLIRIKSEDVILENLRVTFPKFKTLEKLPPSHLSKQFSNLFSSYTQAFNKQQQRKGSLFMKNFKRIHVDDPKYLIKLIHYIHYNPVEAGVCNDLTHWEYSSYNSILSFKNTAICRAEVIELFDDIDNFRYCHQSLPKEVFGG